MTKKKSQAFKICDSFEIKEIMQNIKKVVMRIFLYVSDNGKKISSNIGGEIANFLKSFNLV
jgi:hypothetical protein